LNRQLFQNDFLKWSEEEHAAQPSTHVRYKTSSVALLSFFGDTPLDKITPEEVERFKTTRSGEFKTVRAKGKGVRVKTKKRVRPATVNRELACLKAVFNFAIKADVVVRNPVSRVKFLAENNQQTRVLSHTEERDYFAKASPILRDVARLILERGRARKRSIRSGLRTWIWSGECCKFPTVRQRRRSGS